MSFSATDEIRDFPTTYTHPAGNRIVRPNTNVVVAPNFTALLNTDTTDLINSVDNSNLNPWTFSGNNGELGLSHCINGTDGTVGENARTGDTDETNVGFINSSGHIPCNTLLPVYCISWSSAPIPTNIPTLSLWGLLLLSTIIGFFGVSYKRKPKELSYIGSIYFLPIAVNVRICPIEHIHGNHFNINNPVISSVLKQLLRRK